MFTRVLLIAFVVVSLTSGDAKAQGCCSPGSPSTGGLERGSLEAGQIRILPSLEFTPLGKLIDGNNEIDNPSDRQLDAWVYALDVEYGITSRFTLMSSLSYSLRSRKLMGFSAANGGPVRFDADTHGLGDLILLAKYKVFSWTLRSQQEIDIGAGVRLPTGAYDIRDSGVKAARDLLPGSGAYHLTLWSFFYKSFRPGPIGLSLSFNYNRPGTSEDEYRYAQELNYTAGVIYELTDLFDIYLQARGRWAGSDLISGRELPGTGGHWVYIQPGVGIKPSALASFYAVFQIPAFHDLNGTQLAPEYVLRVGSSIVFSTR